MLPAAGSGLSSMLITWDTIRVRRGPPLFEPSAFLFVGEIRKLQWAGNAMGLLFRRQTCSSCSNKMRTGVCLCVCRSPQSSFWLCRDGDQSRSSQIWDLFLQHGAVSRHVLVGQLGLWGVQLWVWARTHTNTHTYSLNTSVEILYCSYCQTSFACFYLSLVM